MICNKFDLNLLIHNISLIMLRYRYLYLFICFLFACKAESQTFTQTIRGRVIDRDSRLTLPGASIVIYKSNPLIGAVSNIDGEFHLTKVPAGRHDIQVTFMGYETTILRDILVGTGKEVVLSIEIAEKIADLQTVEIKSNDIKQENISRMAVVSVHHFSVEETKRYAASINDPARMAMSFAGIRGSNDMKNEIIVRGNNPRGLTWRLEGVDIPPPSHLIEEGSSGGGVMLISSNVIANSEFYTGAFPAEYGNALSGVFDIKLRNGNNEKREYTFQAGFLGLDFATEGPFRKNSPSSYLFNYRYSAFNLLNKLGVKISGDAVPSYQDLSFKIFLPTKKSGIFSIFGIGGLSKIKQDYGYRVETYDSDMWATGISHTYQFAKNSYLKSMISYSGTVAKYGDHFLLKNNDSYYSQFFGKTFLSASVSMNSKISSRKIISAGLTYTQMFYNGTAGNYNNVNQVYYEVGNDKGNTSYLQAYIAMKYRFNDKFTFNSGLHFLELNINHHFVFEPRFGLEWNFAPNMSLSLGYGKHSRIESLIIYLYKFNYNHDYDHFNEDIGFFKAHHIVLGYDYFITEKLHLHFETYYQYLFDVPVRANKTDPFSLINYETGPVQIPLANKGSGKNYGVELTFEKLFSKNYFFMFTSSVYESKYKGSDGIERNTRYNGNYAFNLLGGKEFVIGKKEKANTLGFSARGVWYGGNWFTPIDLTNSIRYNREVRSNKEPYSKKAKDYYRIDFQIGFRKNMKKSTMELRLDVQNVTNHKNFYDVHFNIEKQTEENVYQMGIIPVLNFRIEF